MVAVSSISMTLADWILVVEKEVCQTSDEAGLTCD
jgi:hypothetical protein